MEKKIKFIKNSEEIAYKPDKQISTFYQICKFKNKDVFQTRKIYFNQHGKVLHVFEKEYNGKIIKSFLKICPKTKCKLYSTNTISNVGLPNASDMIEAQSLLINSQKNTDFSYGAPLI